MMLSRTERQALLDAHLCWTDGDGAMPNDIRILLHRRWIKKQRGGLNPHYEWTPEGIEALEFAEGGDCPPSAPDARSTDG